MNFHAVRVHAVQDALARAYYELSEMPMVFELRPRATVSETPQAQLAAGASGGAGAAAGAGATSEFQVSRINCQSPFIRRYTDKYLP